MNVLVTICCITYNHEKYIEQTIDSFLAQKTDFKYEILVHDDASTDGTANIVREYERRYPTKIRGVYQQENQYSRGNSVQIDVLYLHPLANGRYIANCEGDDYWTDPHKLQKQIDILESDLSLSMCIHSTAVISSGGQLTDSVYRAKTNDARLTCEEMILGGAFFHFSSTMYRKRHMDNAPYWFFEAPGGHTVLPLVVAPHGDVYYIDEVMSVWRKETPEGWTTRNWRDARKRAVVYKALIRTLKSFDSYTSDQYSMVVQEKTQQYKIELLRIEKRGFSLLANREYLDYLKTFSTKGMIWVLAHDLLPRTFRWVAKGKMCLNTLKKKARSIC